MSRRVKVDAYEYSKYTPQQLARAANRLHTYHVNKFYHRQLQLKCDKNQQQQQRQQSTVDSLSLLESSQRPITVFHGVVVASGVEMVKVWLRRRRLLNDTRRKRHRNDWGHSVVRRRDYCTVKQFVRFTDSAVDTMTMTDNYSNTGLLLRSDSPFYYSLWKTTTTTETRKLLVALLRSQTIIVCLTRHISELKSGNRTLIDIQMWNSGRNLSWMLRTVDREHRGGYNDYKTSPALSRH